MADPTLPTSDEAFGASLPTADEAFGAPQTSYKPQLDLGPMSGQVADTIFKNNPISRVMSAYSQAAVNDWGAGSAKVSKETDSWMKDHGVYNDYTKDDHSFIKGLNEQFFRPLIYGAIAAGKLASAGMQGLSAATEQTAEEINKAGLSLQNNPNAPSWSADKLLLGPALRTGAEILSGINQGALLEIPGMFAHMSVSGRATAAVGEGEAGFFNTREVSPQNLQARENASLDSGTPVKAPEPPNFDINDIARKVAPDTWARIDELKDRQENLRLSKGYLESQLGQGYREDLATQEKLSVIPQELQALDEQLRDLIPEQVRSRESVTELLNSDTKEGSAFRDWVLADRLQSALELDGLQNEANASTAHSEILVPGPLERAESLKKQEAATPVPVQKERPVEAPEGSQDVYIHQTKNPDLAFENKPTFFTKKGGENFYSDPDGNLHSIEANLDLKNPLVESNATPSDLAKIKDELIKLGVDKNQAETTIKEMGEVFTHSGQFLDPRFQQALKNLGYDSIVADKTFKNTHVVALEPSTQVKKLNEPKRTISPSPAEQGLAEATEGQPSSPINQVDKEAPVTGQPGRLPEVEGTGPERTSQLSKKIEQAAIDNGLTDSFGTLPQAKQLNMKDQARRTAEFISEDYNRAKRVVFSGTEELPSDIHPTSLIIGMEKYATMLGDSETLRRLSTDEGIASQIREAARSQRILRERTGYEENPVRLMQDIQETRKEVLKNVKERIVREAEVASDTFKSDWESFVKSLECDY